MTLHDRIRARAARLCSPETMERLIDPILTDVQIEHQNAIAEGRVWRSRWVRIAGYFAFVKVIAFYAYGQTVREWSVDEGQAFARTVGVSTAAFVVTALLLISPTVRSVPTNLLLYQIPQTLPLAIPVGVTLGIFCGLGGRVIPLRLKGAALALALTCSAGSLATMAWIIPAASQGYRVSVSEHLRLTQGTDATLSTGPLEMTLSELRAKVDALEQSGRARAARNAAFAYYLRWALPGAPFVLALFALSIMPRLPVRRWAIAVAACGACLSYFLLLLVADTAARQTQLPIAASVWLPNLVFAVASTALMVAAERPSASAARFATRY
jgi:hypothetical protein